MNIFRRRKLPVTVLSGFLGAGKTSVLKHILNNRGGLRVAVIVNDMSELNLDAQMIKESVQLSRTDEKLVEMSNGCICCTLREDLIKEVGILARQNRFDYLLIESTGISEPIPVAQTFTVSPGEELANLSALTTLDTMVTVVDAANFLLDFGSAETIIDRQLTDDGADVRPIVNLLTDQVEFANVIVLNKIDLVGDQERLVLHNLLRKLNPGARIIETSHGFVRPDEILHTKSFDFDEAQQSAGWIKELNGSHTPETEAYGVSSFVFRDPRPFHPARFWNLTQSKWPSTVIRSKGIFWLASRPTHAILLGQAGGSIQAEIHGRWWAAVSAKERRQSPAFRADEVKITDRWTPTWGDRMNELVVIGLNMDEEQVRSEFESCLVTQAEIEDYYNKVFEDPWPL